MSARYTVAGLAELTGQTVTVSYDADVEMFFVRLDGEISGCGETEQSALDDLGAYVAHKIGIDAELDRAEDVMEARDPWCDTHDGPLSRCVDSADHVLVKP